MRRLTDKLSYANIVASLALFIGLGGASYAAVALPANSVGLKQLRAGAVGTSALDFPLGAAGTTDNKVVGLRRCPSKPTGVLQCAPPLSGGLPVGQDVHVFLHAPGRLVASAIVGLKYEGPAQAGTHVMLRLYLDQRAIGHDEVVIRGGQSLQVPIQAVINSNGGSHIVGVRAQAPFGVTEPGNVLVTNTAVAVSAFPDIPTTK